MQLINYPFSDDQSIRTDVKSIVVLDSLLYSTHQVNLPSISTSRVKQAVIYALEDELLQPIDELSVFVNKKTNDIWSVIVIADQTLDDVRNSIVEKQIDCQAVIPAFMCLPAFEGKISYVQQDDWVLFRSGQLNGGKINQEIFFQLHSVDDCQPEVLGEHHQGFNFLRINLWQKYSKQIQQFKSSMVALILVFLLGVIGLVLENQQLSQDLQEKIQTNTVLFKNVFPKVERIVDLPVQLDNQLAKIDKWQGLLNKDLLLAVSKYQFDKKTKSIEFENNKLKVLK